MARQPDDPHKFHRRVGNARRDAYGNLIPGEFNERGRPIGNPQENNIPMSREAPRTAFAEVLAPRLQGAVTPRKPEGLQGEPQVPTPTERERVGDDAEPAPVTSGIPNVRSAFAVPSPAQAHGSRLAGARAAGGALPTGGPTDEEIVNRRLDAIDFNAGRGGPEVANRVTAARAGAPTASQAAGQTARRDAFQSRQNELNAQLDTATRVPADVTPVAAFEGDQPVRIAAIDPRYQTPGKSGIGIARTATSPAAPPAPAAPHDWQRAIVDAYPQVGVAGSPENAAFVKAFREGQHSPETAFQAAHDLFGQGGRAGAQPPAPAAPPAIPAPFAVTPQTPQTPQPPVPQLSSAFAAPEESAAVRADQKTAQQLQQFPASERRGVRERAMNKLTAQYPGVDPKAAPRADTSGRNLTAAGRREPPLTPLDSAKRKVGEWTMGAAGKMSNALTGSASEGSAFDMMLKKISGRPQAPVAPFKKIVTAY